MELLNESRILPIKGGYNFRDLGGIKTKDDRIIKPNHLIRTDELSQLDKSDLQILSDLNIKSVIDFRTEQERAVSVDKVPSTCQNEFHLDIMAGNMNAFMQKVKSGETDFKSMLHHFYTDLVRSENAQFEYRQFFKILQNPAHCAVIYHCTAGKDRTGVATALILEALNVDESIIQQDYLLSNQFLAKKYESYIRQNPLLADLFLVHSEYLEGAIDTIKKHYYSLEDYLTNVLNVDLDQMKAIYTE